MESKENKSENEFVKINFNEKEKKSKKWVKKLIITLALMIIATGVCVYINKDSILKKESGKVEIYKNIEFAEKLELEAGEKFDINNYIKRVIGGELIIDEEVINKIDTKKVGKTTIKLSVKDANGEIQEFECKLNIVDTIKPEIKGAKSKIDITIGDKVDLLDSITAKDAIDGEIEVKVEGKYNIDKVGEYDLKYVAEDKSGNKAEKEFTLVVNKKEETKNTTITTTNKSNTTSNKTNTATSKNNTSTSNDTSNKTTTSSLGSYQSASGLLTLVNSTRKSAEVENVSWSSSLESAAKTRAKELATSYSHTRPDGSAFYTVNSNVYAENIAYGYTSVNSVHNAWVGSSGHYKNITNSSYKTMGAACYVANGQTYWVELFGY